MHGDRKQRECWSKSHLVARGGQEGCGLGREGSGLQQALKLVPSLGIQIPVRMHPQPEEGKMEYRGAGKRWTVDIAVVTDGCRADSGPVLFTMLLASQGRVCF